MQNLVFTQLSIDDLRKLIREEQTEATKEVLSKLIEEKDDTKLEDLPKYLNKKEAARVGSVCTSTIDNWIRAGYIRKYKFGEAVRIKYDDLLKYLESLAS